MSTSEEDFAYEYAGVLMFVVAGLVLPALAQQVSQKIEKTPALEKELYEVELKWMKAEFDEDGRPGQHGRALDGRLLRCSAERPVLTVLRARMRETRANS